MILCRQFHLRMKQVQPQRRLQVGIGHLHSKSLPSSFGTHGHLRTEACLHLRQCVLADSSLPAVLHVKLPARTDNYFVGAECGAETAIAATRGGREPVRYVPRAAICFSLTAFAG